MKGYCRKALIGCVGALLWGSAGVSAQERGGTLVFAITNGEPANYDCHANTSNSVLHRVAPHYSTLLKIGRKDYPQIVGDAAESWSISDDQRSYRFTLRPNIRFHDGTPLTSADVRATYERIVRPPQGVVSIRQQLYRDIVAIDAPDARAVVFRLEKPNAAMPVLFASPWNCLYAATRLAANARDPETSVMGSGPFRFLRHVAGAEWVGERFPDYFMPGLPRLDGFKALSMSQVAGINAMIAGQIGTDFRGVSVPERDRIVAARGDGVRVGDGDELFYLALTFNNRRPPFDDPRVRRALNLAIDRWGGVGPLSRISISNSVGGMLRPGSAFALAPDRLRELPGFRPDMAANRAEARRLLAEAGAADLKVTLINRPEFSPLGVFVLDQWRQIGVSATQDQPDNARYFSSLNAGNFEAIVDATFDYVDEPVLQFQWAPSMDINPNNRARVIDRTVDDLYERQMRTTDALERAQLVHALERHLMEQAYRVPLFWSRRYNVVAAEIGGWRADVPSNLVGQDLAEMWLPR